MITVIGPEVVPEVLSYSKRLSCSPRSTAAVVRRKRPVPALDDLPLGEGRNLPVTGPLQGLGVERETPPVEGAPGVDAADLRLQRAPARWPPRRGAQRRGGVGKAGRRSWRRPRQGVGAVPPEVKRVPGAGRPARHQPSKCISPATSQAVGDRARPGPRQGLLGRRGQSLDLLVAVPVQRAVGVDAFHQDDVAAVVLDRGVGMDEASSLSARPP